MQILRTLLEFHLEPDHGILPQQSDGQTRADVREERNPSGEGRFSSPFPGGFLPFTNGPERSLPRLPERVDGGINLESASYDLPDISRHFARLASLQWGVRAP